MVTLAFYAPGVVEITIFVFGMTVWILCVWYLMKLFHQPKVFSTRCPSCKMTYTLPEKLIYKEADCKCGVRFTLKPHGCTTSTKITGVFVTIAIACAVVPLIITIPTGILLLCSYLMANKNMVKVEGEKNDR